MLYEVITLTVTDANACRKEYRYAIEEPAPLASELSTTSIVCSRVGSIEALVSGGVPDGQSDYILQWDDPGMQTGSLFTSHDTGWYYLHISDWNNCQRIDSAFLDEEPTLEADLHVLDSIRCKGETNGSMEVLIRNSSAMLHRITSYNVCYTKLLRLSSTSTRISTTRRLSRRPDSPIAS